MRRELGTTRDLGILILRLGMGGLMLSHGWSKVLKLVQEGTGVAFRDPIGIGSFSSFLLTTFAEFACAILVVLGVKTRLASIPPVIVMGVAAFMVHINDPWGRLELPLLFMVGYLALIFTGSGKYALLPD